LGSSALLDLVNIVQVGLDLRNATGAKNLLSKFTKPQRALYRTNPKIGVRRIWDDFGRFSIQGRLEMIKL